jgi:hypothetical protein
MFLKIDKETKHLIEEISALSGIQRDVIREVWEFTFIRWLEQITNDPEKLQTLTIPFLGAVGVRYTGDTLNDDGSLETQAESFVALSSSFRSVLGDVYDEKRNIIIDILQKKIDNAISTILEDDE